MQRLLAAVALVLLLARPALAQAPPPSPPLPPAAGVNVQASVEASYLLASYMAALANAGLPLSQSDIDEATRQYLTNGAAATGVPTRGPAAAYFQNGAAVTGVPTSGPGAAYFNNGSQVLAYYPPPRSAPAETAQPPATEVDAGSSSGSGEEAGAPDAAEETGPVAMPTEAAPPAPTTGPTTETAVVPVEAPAAPPPGPTSCPPCVAATTPPPALATSPTESPASPPGPSTIGRVGTALGGALFGGFAVFLWSRPRPPRTGRSGNGRTKAK
jgi:hypothetical protein